MQAENTTHLTEIEEELLVRFFDGECNALERRQVRALIEKREAATEYLGQLGRGSKVLKSYFDAPDAGSDMWQRVSRRIADEERSAVFLGQRVKENSVRGFVEELFSFRGLGLSGLGAAITASVLLFVMQINPAGLSTNSDGLSKGLDYMSASRELSSSSMQPVSTNSFLPPSELSPNLVSSNPGVESGGLSLPISRLVQERFPSTMEVDWVRSHGSVRLIQDPSDRSPVIWVQKRNSFASQMPQRRSNRAK